MWHTALIAGAKHSDIDTTQGQVGATEMTNAVVVDVVRDPRR
jgi:hypothetical protein